uniref:Odorant receptor n=1 Tax=Eogystia hippophaecolus TaxID=1206364 RepID=A0A1B3P5M7_EOGHI|nr:odorant receptor [Eogystia hippophaecolus]
MQTQTCLHVWAPFDYRYDFHKWLIVHIIINVYVVAHGCGILGIFDVVFYIIVFHLIGHIKVLKYKIKTQFEGDLDDEEVKKRLVNVIKYHAFIIKFFKDVEAAFGINVSGNYLNNLIADSLMLYNLMIIAQDKGTVIIFVVMTTVCITELILMSFILEEVRIQSDDLPELIYFMPWENWSLNNKKMLVLILLRIQPELAFVAAGGLRAGVRPMTSIIKSTFSYYVMLKSSMRE